MEKLKIEAKVENLDKVTEFVDGLLEAYDCPMKTMMRIDVAVEEIFVNVAHYAYTPDTGDVEICVDVSGEPPCAAITFTDSGVPYDPLAKEDPDVTQSVEERPIGGLGIYMVKNIMDDVEYEYKDGQNIFTITKNIE